MPFSRDEVLECAHFAQMAYQSDAVWASVPGAHAKSDSVTDCQCYVVTPARGKMAYVVFRGTSSFQDALQDCQVELVDYSPHSIEKVHAGFKAQVDAVLPFIRECLKAWSGEIRCCGHSLGASTAQLTACILAEEYKHDSARPVSFIGFGTPRVGDTAFKKLFESLVTRGLRIKNGRDPVTAVPPGPYMHAGEEKHVGRADPHPEAPLLTNLADHDMTTGYMAECTKDDPKTKGVPLAQYLLMFVAGKLMAGAHLLGN